MREFLSLSPWLSVALISWLLAQIAKLAINTLATKRLDFSRLVDTGGMPSSHTALVSGLSASVGLTEGWTSAPFAISACISAVIVYDATNLRRSAGWHAEWLNEIVPQLLQGKIVESRSTFRKLRELLGHNPVEVLVGGILGVLVALWFTRFIML
ncbi:MAG TPA: divergent PAP2 family protein [Firmicutes bacterium]|nr:divergent PAP2 family protein [Bacillota bacterium]